MASPLASSLDSYHSKMLSKLQGISQPQVSDGAQAVIAALAKSSAPTKRSKIDSIKVPNALLVANSVKSSAIPTVLAPTGGLVNSVSQTSQPVNRAASSGGNSTSAPAAGGLDAFLAKIAKKESGGNYNAVNKDSGALGKYQVMPANVASWTKQALGKSLTPQQFLKDTNAQEAVAKAILGGYHAKYGEKGAAIAWYSGESKAKKFAATGQVSTKAQGGGKYPSIAAYAAAIAGR